MKVSNHKRIMIIQLNINFQYKSTIDRIPIKTFTFGKIPKHLRPIVNRQPLHVKRTTHQTLKGASWMTSSSTRPRKFFRHSPGHSHREGPPISPAVYIGYKLANLHVFEVGCVICGVIMRPRVQNVARACENYRPNRFRNMTFEYD